MIGRALAGIPDRLAPVRRLMTTGHFTEALKTLGELQHDKSTRREADVLRAALLERVGRYGPSRELATRLLDSELSLRQRNICEYTLGVIDWDEGQSASGLHHIQRSILIGKRSHDLERLCWSQLRLWLMLANGSGIDAGASVLAELRSNATRLGDTNVLAALHIFIAEAEAKRGLLVSARRHIRAATGLLSAEPNPWLEAWAENINVAIAILLSQSAVGLYHGRRAVELSRHAGAAALGRACLANYGNLLTLAGRFDEAIEYFERAIEVLPAFGDNANGAFDAIASIRLAQGRIEEAGQLLDRIESSVGTPDDRKLYVFRHAVLTRVRYFMQLTRWEDALALTNELTRLADDAADCLLRSVATLTRAEISLHTAGSNNSIRILSDIVDALPDLPPDFHVRYEGLFACALAISGDHIGGRLHLDRARRIAMCVGSAPLITQLENGWSSASSKTVAGATTHSLSTRAEVALQGAATLVLHARHPLVVARELVRLLADTGCVTYAAAVAMNASNTREVLEQVDERCGSAVRVIDVGNFEGKKIRVEFLLKAGVEATATINAVSFLMSAIHELERARREREELVRLWPSEDPPNELAGAVVEGQLHNLMSLAQRVARTTMGVLITGESGTGKEILARAVHGYSPRAEKPFVPFNCTAVPREMLESQLFGHRRGAFTGADRDHPGLIRSAKDGTLFLDEIGELGLDLQPKLLRFLESGEICPLGEPSPFTVDVRIIAATNSNLEQLVQDGRFREDLFYRLNVIRLTIPPLRERRDEIPALVHHFVARAAAEFAKGRVRVAEETMEHLLLYPWPGNVRQLQNELRRMVALADLDAVLAPSALAPDIRRATLDAEPARPAGRTELAVPLNEKLLPTLSRIEREMITAALRANQGRVEAAAKALGISRKGLYLKRQRLGLLAGS